MAEENSLMTVLEAKFQGKLSEYSHFVARWLEDFNDRHLGNSELGRILHYKDLKPKFGLESSRSKYFIFLIYLADVIPQQGKLNWQRLIPFPPPFFM